MTHKQVIVAALVLGVTAALVVWWLEQFNRERLKADWLRFVESWERLAPGQAAE
jgi:hypothetical protein